MKIIDLESLLIEANNRKQKNNKGGNTAPEVKQVISFKAYSDTIDKLNNFAEKYSLTRTQVLEALVEFLP